VIQNIDFAHYLHKLFRYNYLVQNSWVRSIRLFLGDRIHAPPATAWGRVAIGGLTCFQIHADQESSLEAAQT
jgi:hypothetical protein